MNEQRAFSVSPISDQRGRGLITHALVCKGALVLKYVGEHITEAEAIRREEFEYFADKHCYMFYYTKRDKRDRKVTMCVDATKHHDSLARMINHSKKHANLKPELRQGEIWFRARCDIQPGTELLFDYGETRKDVLDSNMWLRE